MPQMSPLPWLILMLFFIMSLMIMAFQSFHNKKISMQHSSSQIKTNQKNWPW